LIVFFALMPNGKDSYCLVIFDLEQGDIAGVAEGDEQFAQEWISALNTPAGKRGFLEKREAMGQGSQRSFGCLNVLLEQEMIKALDIDLGFDRETNTKTHFLPCAASSME
jgi:hypothetical protein